MRYCQLPSKSRHSHRRDTVTLCLEESIACSRSFPLWWTVSRARFTYPMVFLQPRIFIFNKNLGHAKILGMSDEVDGLPDDVSSRLHLYRVTTSRSIAQLATRGALISGKATRHKKTAEIYLGARQFFARVLSDVAAPRSVSFAKAPCTWYW